MRVCLAALLVLLLAACEQQEDMDERSTGGAEIERLQIAIGEPWSVAVKTDDDGATIASISHSEGYLAVWEIDRERGLELQHQENVGFHPDFVRWVDWDDDGDSDELLVTVEGRKKVQLWRDGFMGLSKIGEITTADAPQTLQIVDLDADGHRDLIIGPYDEERVTLYWGNGDGAFTFDEPSYVDAHKAPTYPQPVDWDGDGRTDIVWSNWETGTVQLTRNTGSRKFIAVSLHDVEDAAPRQVRVADLDRDGHPDMIVALEVGKAARILYNDGRGLLRGSEDIPAPTIGYSEAIATEDADGELLLAMSEVDQVVFAKRDGDGWALRRVAVSGLLLDLQFADLDADGHLDLLLPNTGGRQIEVLFGPLWQRAEEIEL